MILFDTCIMIEYLKDNIDIVNLVNKINIDNIFISDIIIMELYIGALDNSDLKYIQRRISNFRKLDTNQNIIGLAKDIVSKYCLSHRCKMNDSIIASTSIIYDIDLFTYNLKDFKYIPGIKLFKL